jgi:hypothetical protein
VVPVAKKADTVSSASELNTQLYQVLSRIKELQGQTRRAREEGKPTEEEVYIAQLKQAEAEKARYESALKKLQSNKKRSEHDDDDADPARQDQDNLRKQLLNREQELMTARKQLAELADRSKQAEVRGRDADSARAQLDMLKKQIVEMNLRVNDQHNRSSTAERELASRLEELKAREQQLKQSEAQLRAQRDGLDQAMKKQAQSFASTSEDYKRVRDAADGEKRGREARRNPGALAGELPGVDPTAGAGGKLAAGTLDLVALATSYADAVGNVRLAQVRVKTGDRDSSDQALNEAGLQAAERKARLLRSIAEIAVEGAKAEYEQSRQLNQQGLLPQSKVVESEAKLKILKVILDADGQSGGNSKANNSGARR